MKTSTWITAAALLAVGFGTYALEADAQEGKDKPADAAASKDDLTWFMPGPEQKALAEKVGKWTFKMKYTGMDGKPVEEPGTSELKMSLNGMFLEDTTVGTMMGGPFEGHGFTGFDKIKGKYTGVWLDTMGAGCIMNSEGSYDATSKTFTFMMDMPDGMTHQYVKEKMVEKMTDKDHFTSTFTKVGAPVDDMGNFSIEYTRAK